MANACTLCIGSCPNPSLWRGSFFPHCHCFEVGILFHFFHFLLQTIKRRQVSEQTVSIVLDIFSLRDEGGILKYGCFVSQWKRIHVTSPFSPLAAISSNEKREKAGVPIALFSESEHEVMSVAHDVVAQTTVSRYPSIFLYLFCSAMRWVHYIFHILLKTQIAVLPFQFHTIKQNCICRFMWGTNPCL